MIMYEMLVGKTPFEGQTYVHLLKNIETTKVRLPKLILKNTSRDCLDLMVRLLQRDPSKRIDFEAFFQHPFVIKRTLKEEEEGGPSTQNQASSSTLNDHVPPDWDPVLPCGSSSDEDLAYSSDDEFVIIFRQKKLPGDTSSTKHGLLGSKTELDEHLLRVSDCIVDLADARACGGLMSDAFYLSTVSLQILDYLISNESTSSVLTTKMDQILKKANEFSLKIEDHETCGSLYGMMFDHALACSKGAAGGELMGQYTHASELYMKSIDQLQFLLNEGYDVTLDNPIRLPKYEKERIRTLILKIKDRKTLCTTNEKL